MYYSKRFILFIIFFAFLAGSIISACGDNSEKPENAISNSAGNAKLDIVVREPGFDAAKKEATVETTRPMGGSLDF